MAHGGATGDRWNLPSLLSPSGSVATDLGQNNHGGLVLDRHTWLGADGSEAMLQAYVEQSVVDVPGYIREQRTTADLDFQHRLNLGAANDVVWGLNLRQSRDRITTGPADLITISPERRSWRLASLFVRDEVTLVPGCWRLVLGTKLEHNNWTGFEPQPNVRLAFTPSDTQTWWAALPIEAGGRPLTLTASVGIAMFPRDAREPRALASCAEQAAYEAKRAGRAQLRFFDEAIDASARMRLTRESELRHGIGDGQLRLHYQPKFDVAAGRLVGAEALVRWQHPDRGLVPPVDFIPLAEDSGLILPLTDWVLEAACADLRRRAEAGLPPVPVSVNLASPCFLREDLADHLDTLLARHGIAPAWLTLEVTESLLMKDVEQAVRRLQQLRERGLRLSLDDFGTGYSSLAYLKLFPVDELKIDRSFVVDAWRGGRHGAIARSIVALGREFGLQVIAEGVETAAQSRFLRECGCAWQQGFLFARPLDGATFDAWLTARRDLRLDLPLPS